MSINLNDYKCQYCGKTCTNFVFAAFVCDDPACIEKARIDRGGPGGHMKRKAEGRPIIPEDLIEKK
jgi:hypothetical protein